MPSPSFFFFFNDTATTEIYTLSLHDALPICWRLSVLGLGLGRDPWVRGDPASQQQLHHLTCGRSEEHTSELQSLTNLVCRLLLEKKKDKQIPILTLTDHFALANSNHIAAAPF